MGRPKKTVWDEQEGRYRFKTSGNLVRRGDVVKSLERGLDKAKSEVRRLDRALAKGEIDSLTWRNGMRDQIRIAHTTAAALGKGGLNQMTAADWGKVGAQTKAQYAALQRYERQIANGLVQTGTKAQKRRSSSYIDAAKTSYWAADMKVAASKGLLAKSVLGSMESCHPKNGVPGCYEEAAKPARPVHLIPPIGTRTCRGFCKCRIVYVKPNKAKGTA